ncbi:hypothetical protein N9C95_00940 [Gammaproteobacteria bacterium]|nr:hypothetical protein [Gammaproteobacteria bacterium]
MSSDNPLTKSNEPLARQAKINNALMVAQSFQMSKMNKSLENVSETMEVNNQIQAALYNIQNEIKTIQTNQLKELSKAANQAEIAAKEAIKANKLKEYEIEQNRLRFEQEQSEKEYIRSQRNLAFELKNSVQEVEESDSTILEKYFFLKTSLEIFEELDTEKFEISEMEYSREAFNSMVKSKDKYESMLTDSDIKDLNTIKNIELEDENQYLSELKTSLKKIEKFKQSFQELIKLNTKNLSSSASQKAFKEKMNDLLKELKAYDKD